MKKLEETVSPEIAKQFVKKTIELKKEPEVKKVKPVVVEKK